MAMARHTASAASDNSSVAGKRSSTIGRTGAAKRIDRPQSPRARPCKISHVLHAERLVEPQRMAKLRKVLDARILAQHLQHGIARNNVDHQKNHGEDQPKSGQRVKKTLKEMPDHLGFSTFSAAGFVVGRRRRSRPAPPASSIAGFSRAPLSGGPFPPP